MSWAVDGLIEAILQWFAGVIVGGISVGLFVLGILFFVVAASTVSFGP